MNTRIDIGQAAGQESLEEWIDTYTICSFLVRSLLLNQDDLLHETGGARDALTIPDCGEWFLQALWNEGRLMRCGDLLTEDGQNLKILHPGTWNSEAGPDFSRAAIWFDGKVKRGDIEIHRSTEDWLAHGHYGDQRYQNVILHVVWEQAAASNNSDLPPCLEMRKYFSPRWAEMLTLMSIEGYPYSQKIAPGCCALQTAEMEDSAIRDFLTAAGLARFRRKSQDLLNRALKIGFAQTAYEIFWEALGYKANRLPFQELARQLPLAEIQKMEPWSRLAALWGCAGFLIDPTRHHRKMKKSDKELNDQLWFIWWKLGMTPLDITWQRSGVRPANRPEQRLPVGWMLLEKWHYRPVETWCRELPVDLPEKKLPRQLMELFTVSPTTDIKDSPLAAARIKSSLGKARILDIAVNLILPLLHAKACHENEPARQQWAEKAFLAMPKLQENIVLKRITHRLLVPASRHRQIVQHAVQQQGLLAVAQDFCDRMAADCTICPLNERRLFEIEPSAFKLKAAI